MGRYSLKEADPALYEQILQEQRAPIVITNWRCFAGEAMAVHPLNAQTVMRKYSSLRFRSGEQERLMNIIGRTTEN